MSSPAQRAREEERRLSARTLVIASVASATAAVITSQFWAGGTPIAAAVTPVIVSVVSELLHKPTSVIAERLTTDRPLLREPASRLEEVPTAPDRGGERPVTYHRTPPSRRRRIYPRVVALTAVIAFLGGAAILTLPELIAGQSVGKSSRRTTLLGGHTSKDSKKNAPTFTGTTPQTGPQTSPQQTTPKQTTQQQRTPPTTTPTTTRTTPQPAPPR